MFIELHDSSRDHPKLIKVARDLCIPKVYAYGHLCSLWAWALRMAPDGDLSSFDVDDIEIGAEWDGEQGAFVGALVARGLIDRSDAGLMIHDWDIYAEHLKSAKRKRSERERKRKSETEASQCHVTSRDVTGQGRISGPVTQTDQNRPEPNRTEPTEPTDCHTTPSKIENGSDLEVVVAALGFAVSVSTKDRARAKRIASTGAITADEISEAAEITRASTAKNRVAYFLGVIEGKRNEAFVEASRPTPPANRSTSPPLRIVDGYEKDLSMAGVIGGLGSPRPDEVEKCRQLGVSPADVESNMEHRSWPSWLDAREADGRTAQTTA
jgi:hypothetical protein